MNTHTPIMKVYTCAEIVGEPAVITAASDVRAAEMLTQYYKETGQNFLIYEYMIYPVNLDDETVRIMRD